MKAQSSTISIAKQPLTFARVIASRTSNEQSFDPTCKRGSVGQSEGLLIPRSSVRFRLKPENSNPHGFELHRPSIKDNKLLLKVIKAIIIILGPNIHVTESFLETKYRSYPCTMAGRCKELRLICSIGHTLKKQDAALKEMRANRDRDLFTMAHE